MISSSDYTIWEGELELALEFCKSYLSEEAIAHVRFYVDHGEIEMAYESLCLSLFGERVIIPDEAKRVLLPLGQRLGLDKESVFDVDFWIKAQKYLTIT